MSRMECVILAAGKGTRLGLSDRPKVMAGIYDRPLLHHTVETVYSLRIDKPIVVIGHMGEVVKEYFGADCIYAEQARLNGNGGALIEANKLLSKDSSVLVLQGDDSAFYKSDTLRLGTQLHENSNADLTLLLTNDYDPKTFNTQYDVLRNSVVTKLIHPIQDPRIGMFPTGSFVVNKNILDEVLPELEEIDGVLSTTQIVMECLARSKKVIAQIVPTFEWFGINTPRELWLSQEMMSRIRS